jgi:hypothetical protein
VGVTDVGEGASVGTVAVAVDLDAGVGDEARVATADGTLLAGALSAHAAPESSTTSPAIKVPMRIVTGRCYHVVSFDTHAVGGYPLTGF